MGNSDATTSMHKDHYENLYAVINGQKTFILHPPTDILHIPYETYKLAKYKENSNGKFEIIDICKEDEAVSTNQVGKIEPEDRTELQNELRESERKEPELISWISIDPLKPDFEKYPQYANCKPYIAKIFPGDLLYLPSLWFHHVTQADQTIAINFWYDMEYDIKYNYFKFAEHVLKNSTTKPNL